MAIYKYTTIITLWLIRIILIMESWLISSSKVRSVYEVEEWGGVLNVRLTWFVKQHTLLIAYSRYIFQSLYRSHPYLYTLTVNVHYYLIIQYNDIRCSAHAIYTETLDTCGLIRAAWINDMGDLTIDINISLLNSKHTNSSTLLMLWCQFT